MKNHSFENFLEARILYSSNQTHKMFPSYLYIHRGLYFT